MTDKKSNGWKPGQSGNPKGKSPGSGHLQRLRASLQEHVPEIIDQLVQAAKGGDIQAARILLDRVFPPMKATEQAVELDLPEGGTLTAKAESLLTAASHGLLAPSQAAQLITAIGAVAKICEIDELVTRITALEEKHNGNS